MSRHKYSYPDTSGNKSKVRKIDAFQAMIIRAEYSAGKRGKEHAWRWKISGCHYNRIGRREYWVQTTSYRLTEVNDEKHLHSNIARFEATDDEA